MTLYWSIGNQPLLINVFRKYLIITETERKWCWSGVHLKKEYSVGWQCDWMFCLFFSWILKKLERFIRLVFNLLHFSLRCFISPDPIKFLCRIQCDFFADLRHSLPNILLAALLIICGDDFKTVLPIGCKVLNKELNTPLFPFLSEIKLFYDKVIQRSFWIPIIISNKNEHYFE